jgi:hypothetical protein
MAKSKKPAEKAKPTPVAGGKFKRTKAVTLPILKMEDEVTRYLKFNDKMYVGKEQKAAPGKKQMEPATLVAATDVETGEQGLVIVNAVLKGILEEQYVGDDYVGKAFEITRHAKADGKRYNTFSVFEIDV